MNKKMTLYLNKREPFIQLFGKITECILVINSLGIIKYLNPLAENMFSVKCSECKDRSIHTLIPNYHGELNDENEKILSGVRGYFHRFPIEIQSKSLTVNNELFEVIYVKDLLEGKSRTEQMRSLSKDLADIKLALDASTIVAITDAAGMITLANQKFCELSKYKEEELIGQNHKILNSGYHTQEFFREMWRTISNGEIWKGEIRNKAKDGSLYWVDTTIVPFLDDNGKPYQYVSIRTDITKRVNMEKELQEAMKNDFIHTMRNLQNGIFKMKKDKCGNLVYTMGEGKLLDEIEANTEVLFNKTPQDVFSKDIAQLKQSYYERAFEGHRVNYEVELSGKLLYVDVSPIKHGVQVIEIMGTVHDITELRSTQRKLEVNQQLYQSLIEHSQDFVISFDSNGQIINTNPRTEEYLKMRKKTIENLMLQDVFTETNKDIVKSNFAKAVQGNPQNFEIDIINKLGKKLSYNVTFLPIIVDKEIKGVYSIGKDITEQKQIQETNAYLAHHDELTRLPNRRWIEQKLRESLVHAEQNQQQLAVLFIDLDRFKHINDTLGHLIGDRLLELLSVRLLESIDQDEQFAARISGDEFMVLCPVIHSQEEPIKIANNLIENLTSPFYIEDFELFITASIGICIYPTSGTTTVELMKKADIALYRAKDLGRNMYQLYDQSMDERNYQSFLLERDLRKAIINNEFIVHFQPRVDARTGETVGAESLIRWMHPTLGLISPGEFIPLAEETGLIVALGKWMKKRVCEQLVAWKKSGIPLIPISVNISSQRFLQKDFSKEVRELLDEYQLDGQWLEFEITENSIMKNEEYILQTLHELKEMGIRIYIDDFGTGYSSFNYLKTFKLDGIKIDRTFVQNISCESENAGITIAMIKMAQHLKMDVIAEGVETEEELTFLLKQNCHHVQGFYFGKPCGIEEFEKRFM
ncbi:sensor domain-containing protein [Bacillus sp. Marseille-P3661]|uniref:sensor domain-containing protein n=1 Tax=Bacillus sp. Marseille-P3661 TaxID=1936234 RepID=UPI000C84ED99|nr:EAL domain-containing protein [Bacillus sp. Marseille-P3661]